MDFKTRRFTLWLFGLGVMLSMLAWLTAHLLLPLVAQAAEGGSVSIDFISPASAFNDRDTSIYINGSGFTEPAAVTLGTQPLEVQLVEDDLIVVKVPMGQVPGFYDVTVQTEQGEDRAENGFEVKEPPVASDLESLAGWLWSDPFPMRVGYRGSGVGLNVQHVGGRNALLPVSVEFRLDSANGPLLGRTQTSPLAPYAIEATNKVIWQPTASGTYTICAIIDPDNEVQESDESNNVICRPLSVLPSPADRYPPIVDSFEIEDGAENSSDLDVTLDVTATDYPILGGSGMRAIKFIEFEYNYGARRWQWVKESEWVDYESARLDHPWPLQPIYGTRYIQAWAVDHEGNFSSNPKTDVIDLLPSVQEDSVARNDVVIYRIRLEEGESFQATLTSLSGDADLYVWGPNSALWPSPNYSSEDSVDAVAFIAPNTGTYQIEIYGFTAAQYRLSFGTTTSALRWPFQNRISGSKPLPSAPVEGLDVLPQYYDFEPPEPIEYKLYLPITIH